MASTCRSSYILLSAVVLLTILAAAAAWTNWREPGLVIPLNLLQSCRAYLVRRTCGSGKGPFDPLPVLKERCCTELENIVPFCRCGALRNMIYGMPSGGDSSASCSWYTQFDLATTLVSETEYNLKTIYGRPFCLPLGAEGTMSAD